MVTMSPEAVLAIVLAALTLPLLLLIIRGPTTGDRILAIETIGGLLTLVLLLLSHEYGRTIYIDLAIMTVLFSFLATLLIARYLERKIL